jgi:hypothetical protein
MGTGTKKKRGALIREKSCNTQKTEKSMNKKDSQERSSRCDWTMYTASFFNF